MKSFNEYILENYDSINESSSVETKNNADRKKQLESMLRDKDYKDYVDTLNKMLDDPKAKALLIDGFGGKLGDTKLTFEKIKLKVRNLDPTQSEIDVTKSINFPLKKPENIDNYYSTGPNDVMIVGMPLITFRRNFVIDGHHRWSQVYAFNPEAEMVCFNYDGDIASGEMLRAVQGAIAAVKADETNKNDGKLPSEKVDGQNLYDKQWDKEAIIEYVKKTAVSSVIDTLKKYHKELDDMDKVAEYVANNLMRLKRINVPIPGAPNRGDMPQTDKGGPDPNDVRSSMPDKEGSALNKLKDGEIVKAAVEMPS